MDVNPYAPPTVAEPFASGSSVAALLEPAEAEAVRLRLKSLNRLSLLFGAPGLLLQVIGSSSPQGEDVPFTLGGTLLLVVGLGYYARLRGRHPGWGATGLLSWVGLILLLLLPKRCLHCGQRAKGAACGHCGAPAKP